MIYDAIFYSQVSNPHINKGHEVIFQLSLLMLSQTNFQVNFLRQHLLLLLNPMLLPLARGTVCGCPCLESERVPWAFWLKEAATTLLFLTTQYAIFCVLFYRYIQQYLTSCYMWSCHAKSRMSHVCKGTIATATLQFSLEMGARAAKPNGAWNVFGELNQWKRLRANCTFRKRFMLVWTLPREVYFEPVRRYTKLEPCPCTVKSQFACSSCLGTFLYLSQSN